MKFTISFMKIIKEKYKQVLTCIFLFFTMPNMISAQDFGSFSKVEVGINGIALAMERPISNKITMEPTIGDCRL